MTQSHKTPPNNTFRKPPTIVILGPTGAGKSAVAVELAKMLNGEVISCDSMQVYRGMDIGTATPSTEERCGIRHHLINVLSIHERYDANRFVRYAKSILSDLAGRKTPAIIAGGSGMYAKALVYGFDMQPSSPDIFEQVLNEYQKKDGKAKLQREVLKSVPEAPNDILDNPRRLQRAVEIIRLGGTPEFNTPKNRQKPLPGIVQFIIIPERQHFEKSLKHRTKSMISAGWISETSVLLESGLTETPTARQALGYSEIRQYLSGEIVSKDELCQRIITKTRQYARRQRTWFRHQHPGAIKLTADSTTTASDIASEISRSCYQVINNFFSNPT